MRQFSGSNPTERRCLFCFTSRISPGIGMRSSSRPIICICPTSTRLRICLLPNCRSRLLDPTRRTTTACRNCSKSRWSCIAANCKTPSGWPPTRSPTRNPGRKRKRSTSTTTSSARRRTRRRCTCPRSSRRCSARISSPGHSSQTSPTASQARTTCFSSALAGRRATRSSRERSSRATATPSQRNTPEITEFYYIIPTVITIYPPSPSTSRLPTDTQSRRSHKTPSLSPFRCLRTRNLAPSCCGG